MVLRHNLKPKTSYTEMEIIFDQVILGMALLSILLTVVIKRNFANFIMITFI